MLQTQLAFSFHLEEAVCMTTYLHTHTHENNKNKYLKIDVGSCMALESHFVPSDFIPRVGTAVSIT